jgi:teichuronic acid biosynthesis glycosyltransferase TuaC
MMEKENSQLRVLVLSNMYPKNMGGMFIHTQIQHLMKSGCTVRVVAPVPYCPKILRHNERWGAYNLIPQQDTIDNVSVYYPRYFRLPGRWFHPMSYVTQYWGMRAVLANIISEFKPHIIHAQAASASCYAGMMIKREYGIPLVCSLRGSDINVYPYFGKLSMRLAQQMIKESDQLFCVSSALKEATYKIEKPKKEIEVIYNGCEIGMFQFKDGDRSSTRKLMHIGESDKILVFVGDVSRAKGLVELLAAFEELALNMSRLHLFIVGDGPDRPILEAFQKNNPRGNRIHHFGRLQHHEIVKYLNASDAFVFPSHYEGLPNAVLEAMACGLPVVATKVGGIPEAVEDGVSGILVPREDANLLANAINYVITNDQLSRQMGIAGRKIVESKFNWQANALKVIGMYNEVLHV